MPGLIREARDMQGIRKDTAPKKDGKAKPAPSPQPNAAAFAAGEEGLRPP